MSQIVEAFVCASQALNENIVLKVMGLNENALNYVLLSVAREDDEDCHPQTRKVTCEPEVFEI